MENALYLSTRFPREIVIERERQTCVNNVRRRIKAVEIDRTIILVREREKRKKKETVSIEALSATAREAIHTHICIVFV